MPDNKTYRIKADIQNEDHVDVNLSLVQDVNMFEFLSLKIDSENLYRMHTANYGCVAGRVLANNAIGVPNVKISIFIEADEETKADAVLSYLYPYSNVRSVNDDGIVYNLLPEEQLFTCHQNVGTFPSKRMVLDDSNVFEIFDKYYKFTTTTNSAGDYMIFGVPVGTQILHMDVDLSDIGDLLSQRPRDMIYKGHTMTEFENANMFKKDTNLTTLTQIMSQSEGVDVKPFWGEVSEMGEVDSTGVRITRKDINLNYKFEPTCVFIGSLVTDEKSNGFTKNCIPTERMGKMDRLTTGEGTIEMIRKKPDGSVESFSILGNQLIDGNGTWCYQIPMNLDYVRTDEYGNIVPTNDTKRGLPTRASVRFRFSLNDFASDYENNHLTKMLVPNNPSSYNSMTKNYVFGTETQDEDFRDMFWNKVYSVKSYIPRLQKSNTNKEKRFSGIKAVNVNVGNNPMPYNNMRIDITFMFTLQCAIMHTLIWFAGVVNSLISSILDKNCCGVGNDIRDNFNNGGACMTVGDGACPDLEGWYFAPKCVNSTLGAKKRVKTNPLEVTMKRVSNKEALDVEDKQSTEYNSDDDDSVCITNKIDYFMQCIEMSIAQEYDVIQFDFYNDWLNGVLYIPRWFASIKKKRRYLFGLIKRKEKIQACMEDTFNKQRRYVQQCALEYEKTDGKYSTVSSAKGCVKKASGKEPQKCHKGKGRKNVKILGKKTSPGGGFIHSQSTTRSQYAYYFRPCDWFNDNKNRRVNYFATDIILLGSLSNHDIDGIPQSFKELVSSSYQMPTNVAATNMDTISYMYGTSTNSICGGQKIVDLKRLGNTFSNYSAWAAGTDYSDDIENDPTEYELTESAGIDWGYTGPGQDQKIGNSTATYENGFYQPGGHFLGIACSNAESNIKSCINLSRICEIGVEMSQRRLIPKRVGNELVEDSFSVPTGLISRDEITDTGFRSEFATMNHRRLIASNINPLTQRREYPFISMLPRNFDGALSKFTGTNTPYNNLNGNTDTQRTKGDHEYTRTVEKRNIDYYDFRLGVDDGSGNIDNKYLIVQNGNRAYLPMYNNSFYFYFGLHDGSTALDRFYKEFFAQCPEMNEGNIAVSIGVDNVDKCENKAGVVTVMIAGLRENTESEVTYTVKKVGAQVMNSGTIRPGQTLIEIGGLSVGDYDLIISSADFEDIVKRFSIGEEMPGCLKNIAVTVHDFERTIRDVNDNNGRGYVEIDVDPTCTGVTDLRLKYTESLGEEAVISVTGGRTYLPKGNVEYTVVCNFKCGDIIINDYIVDKFNVYMPMEFDLLIGGSDEMTYKTLSEKYNLSSEDWWMTVLTNGSPVEKFYVENAVSFRGSLADKESGKIDVVPRYGRAPYVTELDGNGEMVVDDTSIPAKISFSSGEEDGYDMNYLDFLYPTKNAPAGVGYTVVGSVRKSDYIATFSDRNGADGAVRFENIKLPSIYKPFFFRCIIFRDCTQAVQKVRYSLSVVNGNVNNGLFSDVSVCGDPCENPTVNTQASWWTKTGGNESDFSVYKYVGDLDPTTKTNYSVSVLENGGANPANEMSVEVDFIGDSNNPSTEVRYFLICRTTQYGTRQETPVPNPDYSSVTESLRTGIHYSDATPVLKDVPNGNIPIYWSGSVTKAFDIDLGDGNGSIESGHLIFSPSKELDRDRLFAGDVSQIALTDRKQDCFVLGVYDPWTKLDDLDFAAAQNNNSKYIYAGKDSNVISIFKLYKASTFVEMVSNPDIYDDNISSDDDTQDNFTIMVNPYVKEISTGYDPNLNPGAAYVEETYDLAAFNVSYTNQVISIPDIVVQVFGTNDTNGMDYNIKLKLVNTSEPGEEVELPFIGHNVGEGLQGNITIRTYAMDYPASTHGTGRYKLVADYMLSIPANQYVSLFGGFAIGGTTITVRNQ